MKTKGINKKLIISVVAFLLLVTGCVTGYFFYKNKITPTMPESIEPKNEVVSEFTPEERKMRDVIIHQIITENNKNTSYFRLDKTSFDKDYNFSVDTLKYDKNVAISGVSSGIILSITANVSRFSEILNEEINRGPYNPSTAKIYDFLRCDELQRIIPEAEVIKNGQVCEIKVKGWEHLSEIKYAYNKQLACFEVSNKEDNFYEADLIDMSHRLYDYHKVFSFIDKPFSDECISNSILENK